MPVMRLIASLFLLIAVIALMADATGWLGGTGPFEATSFARHWGQLAPASLERSQALVVRNSAPWVWDPLIVGLIHLPTFVLFGGLALIFGYIGRRRHRINIYAN